MPLLLLPFAIELLFPALVVGGALAAKTAANGYRDMRIEEQNATKGDK